MVFFNEDVPSSARRENNRARYLLRDNKPNESTTRSGITDRLHNFCRDAKYASRSKISSSKNDCMILSFALSIPRSARAWRRLRDFYPRSRYLFKAEGSLNHRLISLIPILTCRQVCREDILDFSFSFISIFRAYRAVFSRHPSANVRTRLAR